MSTGSIHGWAKAKFLKVRFRDDGALLNSSGIFQDSCPPLFVNWVQQGYFCFDLIFKPTWKGVIDQKHKITAYSKKGMS